MDLLHRLNAVTLTLPPLRARRDEIVPLAEHFLRACEPREEAPRRISREVVECLLCYEWPGNLRELRNAIERAAALALGDTIERDDLPDSVRQARVGLGGRAEPLVSGERPALPEAEPVEAATPLSRRLQQYEADLIRRALAQASGHKTNAAKLLKMPLRTFMKRIKEYGID